MADGAVAEAGKVWGCYLHGLFANASLRRAWLTSLGWHGDPEQASASLHMQAVLDTVASHVEASLDMGRLRPSSSTVGATGILRWPDNYSTETVPDH